MTPEQLERERQRQVAARSERRERTRPKRAPGKARKAAKREERNARAAEIRAAVMKRADDRCEWCAREGFVLEWHHLRGGGERRHAESVENTCAVCWDCHRGWERSTIAVLRQAKDWAIRGFMGEALKRIEYRLSKAERSPRPHTETPE